MLRRTTTYLAGIANDEFIRDCVSHDAGQEAVGLRRGRRMLLDKARVPQANIGRPDGR
jgi:hypothetical protein